MEQYFVDKQWVKDQLLSENTRIVDCRFKLDDPHAGRKLYNQEHIPGAVYIDLNKDLAGEVMEHGGRHPLPDFNKLKAKLENYGVNEHTKLIAYDGGEGAFASRFWWMMKYVGQKEVYILDGGFNGWKEAEYPVDHIVPSFEPSSLTLDFRNEMLATYEEIKAVVESGSTNNVLIDSRERNRYLGLNEPIDKKAGHIPGAINKAWMEGFENGIFKDREEQEKRFEDIDSASQVYVYCGSGVTAAPNYLALKVAGFVNVKLYIGSFSDWISYDENEIETGE